jgi:hypothetical protein
MAFARRLVTVVPTANFCVNQEGRRDVRNMNTFEHTRVILGFLVAAALPGAVLGFVAGGNWETWLSFNATILLVTTPYVFVVAAPLYYSLERIGQLRIYWAAMVGGLTAVILDFVENVRWIWNWNNRTVSFHEALQGAPAHIEPAPFFLIGALCGVVGWLIAFGPRIARLSHP